MEEDPCISTLLSSPAALRIKSDHEVHKPILSSGLGSILFQGEGPKLSPCISSGITASCPYFLLNWELLECQYCGLSLNSWCLQQGYGMGLTSDCGRRNRCPHHWWERGCGPSKEWFRTDWTDWVLIAHKHSACRQSG